MEKAEPAGTPRAGYDAITAASTWFELPAFYCPLPPSCDHPGAARMEHRALEWMETLGFFATPLSRTTVLDSRAHELMSWITPAAPDERAQPGVDWAYVAFAFDDLRTDTGPTSISTSALVEWFHQLDYAATHPDQDSDSDDLFFRAAADVSRRVRDISTPQLWRRWLAESRAAYWAGTWEVAQRTAGRTVDMNSYLAQRAQLALGPATLVSAEIAADIHAPEPERHDPVVHAAVDAAALLIGLDDDLYSYPKENRAAQLAGRDPALEIAAIPILVREHDCTAQHAACVLADIRNRIMLRAMRLAERVTTGPYSSDTRALVELALTAVRVGLDWAQRAARYDDPQASGATRLRWNGITDTAPANESPLPFPAVSLWWEV